MSAPPISSPAAAPTPPVAPKRAKTRLRRGPAGKAELSSERVVGPSRAAKAPWAVRAVTSTGKDVAVPAMRLAAAKPACPSQ